MAGLTMAGATLASAGIGAAGSMAQGIGAGLRGKRGERVAKEQIDEQRRQWEQQFAETLRSNEWQRKWGDILNSHQQLQGSHAIELGGQAVKTDRLAQGLQRSQIQREANALQNYTIGRTNAFIEAENYGYNQRQMRKR